jgi:hypothetical protein
MGVDTVTYSALLNTFCVELMRKWTHIAGCSIKITIILESQYTIVHANNSATVVEVLCYKSEGRWFDSRWCHWNFSLT